MGKKTSFYLTDELAAEVADSGLPLARIIKRGLKVTPQLIEASPRGDFVTHWYCEVPAIGARFKVLNDQWLDGEAGIPVREIYQIEITQPSNDE